MKDKKTILLSPLDWGLGHTTRLIPIINSLIKDNNIILAASGISYEYYKSYFPQIKLIKIKGYDIKYSNRNLIAKLILQIPRIFFIIYTEHKILKKLINKYNIDTVISDNRYGLWNKKIKSIFITHQINIKTSKNNWFIEKIIYKINLFFINKFDYCLIPDLENSLFTGELTNKYPLPKNSKFIGLLSRFNGILDNKKQEFDKYDVFVIISGPEPQKTNLQKILIEQLDKTAYKVLIVNGSINNNIQLINNIKIVPNLSDNEIIYHLKESKYIISRSGYSTIMDLFTINRTAILVPTPKQTEQEYLAEIHNKNFVICKQEYFNFNDLKKQFDNFNNFEQQILNNNLLEKLKYYI